MEGNRVEFINLSVLRTHVSVTHLLFQNRDHSDFPELYNNLVSDIFHFDPGGV